MGGNMGMHTHFEQIFSDTVIRILEANGFDRRLVSANYQNAPDYLMIKDGITYVVEIRYSRKQTYSNRGVLSAVREQMDAARKWGWIPLVIFGGIPAPALHAELVGISIKTMVMDIRNLLYMAQGQRELYDELVSQLTYTLNGIKPCAPDLLPIPQWDESGQADEGGCMPPYAPSPISQGDTDGDEKRTEPKGKFFLPYSSKDSTAKSGWDLTDILVHGNMGQGKSSSLLQFWLELPRENDDICQELEDWKSGKHNSQSTQYEKLCTRALKRLFSEDLTLWQEQAKSNANLYRFDLICKIKRDNHKDFWEMAERYFNSKYIIFEFKNYAEEVTQREVYTTLRYLYPTALRRVAIIISPNGINEHADKAIRGALRDEGKLILSLTNEDLIHMLQMKEDGEDPADYLSDKLDALLIDLEK